jgi:hypothetical protein
MTDVTQVLMRIDSGDPSVRLVDSANAPQWSSRAERIGVELLGLPFGQQSTKIIRG